MSAYRAYLKTRFPVVPLSLFCSVSALGIYSVFRNGDYLRVAAVAILYLQFLFHLRVLDEFKDYRYDMQYHSDRPVQTGQISLYAIQQAGIINFLLSATIVFFLSPPSVFPIWIGTYLYTGLMYKEFFLSEFLRQRPVLYLVSHQIVLIPLFYFFYSVFSKHVWGVTSPSDASVFMYTLLPLVLIEIGRKMQHRYSVSGKVTDDTYIYLWGAKPTIFVFSGILILAGVLSCSITYFSFIPSVLIFVAASLLIITGSIHPGIILRHHMTITTVTALCLPLLLLI